MKASELYLLRNLSLPLMLNLNVTPVQLQKDKLSSQISRGVRILKLQNNFVILFSFQLPSNFYYLTCN